MGPGKIILLITAGHAVRFMANYAHPVLLIFVLSVRRDPSWQQILSRALHAAMPTADVLYVTKRSASSVPTDIICLPTGRALRATPHTASVFPAIGLLVWSVLLVIIYHQMGRALHANPSTEIIATRVMGLHVSHVLTDIS